MATVTSASEVNSTRPSPGDQADFASEGMENDSRSSYLKPSDQLALKTSLSNASQMQNSSSASSNLSEGRADDDSLSPMDQQTKVEKSRNDAEDASPINGATSYEVNAIARQAEEVFKGLSDSFGRNFVETRYQDTVENVMDYTRHIESWIPLSKRVELSKWWHQGTAAYFRLIDDRLAALEQSSLHLKEEEKNKSEDAKTKKVESEHAITTGPNRVPWSSFKRKPDQKKNLSEAYAIDVLVGDPVIRYEVWRNPRSRKTPICLSLLEKEKRIRFKIFGEVPEDVEDLDRQKDYSKPEQEPLSSVVDEQGLVSFYLPITDRIRINGPLLKELLGKVLNLELGSGENFIVFLKPFKVFVEHESKIRSFYGQLAKEFETMTREPESVTPEDGSSVVEATEVSPEEDSIERSNSKEGESLLDIYGTKQAYQELACLVQFLDDDLRILKHFKNATIKRIYFPDLWFIFRPGEEVVTSQKPFNAYRILCVTGGRPFLSPPREEKGEDGTKHWLTPYRIPEKSSDFTVTCYQIDFDGFKFGSVLHEFSVQRYDDLRNITTLSIYLLRFVRDRNDIKSTLERNGETFLNLSKGGHVQCHGLNLHEAEEIDIQVIVDFNAALWDSQDKDANWRFKIEFGIRSQQSANQAEVIMVSAGGCKKVDCCENDAILADDSNIIPRDDMLLFPHRLFAFVLKDRKWAVIDVNDIKTLLEPSKKGWESLELPKGHKKMVMSLVEAHFRDKEQGRLEEEIQVDMIRGKGKGLIILLHGAPGVGKTSTAECVAELCKRPLYSITCGDFGITAVDVETRLKRIFIQAQKWKCVLLLDEADVFLSERGQDVKHNSLVSIFLRVLEYYQGILFLTTNRVGKMDEAFRFRSNLQRVRERKISSMRFKVDEIQEFAEKHYDKSNPYLRWNGRQIRNAFQIAVALAESDALKASEDAKDGRTRKPTLRKSHFKIVEDASRSFNGYLKSVHGMETPERTKQNEVRDDDWNPEEDDAQGQGYKHKAKRPPKSKHSRRAQPSESEESPYTESSSASSDIGSANFSETEGDADADTSKPSKTSDRETRAPTTSKDKQDDKEDSGEVSASSAEVSREKKKRSSKKTSRRDEEGTESRKREKKGEGKKVKRRE